MTALTKFIDPLEIKAINWLCAELGYTNGSIDEETDLISNAGVDSITFIELIDFLEKESGQIVNMSDAFDTESASIKSICKLLQDKNPCDIKVEKGCQVIKAYSKSASQYLDHVHTTCWSEVTDSCLQQISQKHLQVGNIAEIGCGTGNALDQFARAYPTASFIGIEPAREMRQAAERVTHDLSNVKILRGRFENLPLEENSIDYLYSLYAFHWTTCVDTSVEQLAKVLKRNGALDLFFTGKYTGSEFTSVTTPIYKDYLGLDGLLSSAQMRLHMDADETRLAFQKHFQDSRVEVSESSSTYFDSLENHWSWYRARAYAHFMNMAHEQYEECEQKVQTALRSLDTSGKGIPYSIHTVHVSIR